MIPSQGGILNDLTNRVKLVLRLMGDPRVSPLLKLLPIGSVLYLIIPDLVPLPFDDLAVMWLGSYMFVEMCPPHVVEEHLAALQMQSPAAHPPESQPLDDVIEGEYWEDKR
jgi:hypothetical protein